MKDAVLCGVIMAAIGENLRKQASEGSECPYYEIRDGRRVIIDGVIDIVDLTKAIAVAVYKQRTQ